MTEPEPSRNSTDPPGFVLSAAVTVAVNATMLAPGFGFGDAVSVVVVGV
jgi:hypothetical protein